MCLSNVIKLPLKTPASAVIATLILHGAPCQMPLTSKLRNNTTLNRAQSSSPWLLEQ